MHKLMQVISAEHAIRMRQALVALCDDVGDFLDSSSLLPVAESLASREMSGTDLGDQLLNAYHQGNLMLESAADHAFALTRLLVEPVPTIAPWTCARGGLEASAMSCWLLEPSITARERVSRSYAFRYDGLREQEKLARSSEDEAAQRGVAARMDEVESQAIARGFSPVLDKHGRRIGIGRVMPVKTTCIADVFGQETLYRILSAMAHSQSSALIQLGLLAFDPAIPTVLKKAMNPDAAAVLLATAADSLTKPTWAKAQLLGLDLKRLKAVLEGRYDEMGLSDAQRFWPSEAPS